MRLAMDADCLIKLTKAGLKERVCEAWRVSIPQTVRRETVDQAPELPDAVRINENIAAGRLSVSEGKKETGKVEEAVLRLFKAGNFDAVATDDTRFIRTLRGLGVAYAVPAVIIVRLREEGSLSTAEAVRALKALRPHISHEEHAAAQLMLSGRRIP
jgi:rRNA-processing protein FCF1